MENNLIREITETTPIVMCTVGQLANFLRESGLLTAASDASDSDSGSASANEPETKIDYDGRKIYGLKGIMKEFRCSKSTAQNYKNGIFKDIVVQNGNKIFLDANKAWRCYENYKGHRKGTS